MKPFHYKGHLHVHSTLSDGASSIPEIIDEARALNLDFLGTTDHDTLKGSIHGGWHKSLLVLSGMEINGPNNHILAFDYLHPEAILPGPEPETLARYDAWCLTRKVAAIGGSDAHGQTYTYRGFSCRTLGPGVYRVEIFLRSRLGREYPWIFSNPIYLRG